MMRRVCLVMTALTVLVAVLARAPDAAAQVPQVLPPGAVWPMLTASDFDRMHAAAGRLYEGQPVGARERWRNPGTNNAGSITLTRIFEMNGMPCRTMTYRIRFAQGGQTHNHYLVDWCRVDPSNWKMVDQKALS